MILFKTARIVVRSFEANDIDGLIKMMTDKDMMQFTGFKEPQTIEKIKNYLTKWIPEGRDKLGV